MLKGSTSNFNKGDAALWVKSHAEEMTGYAHAAGKRAF